MRLGRLCGFSGDIELSCELSHRVPDLKYSELSPVSGCFGCACPIISCLPDVEETHWSQEGKRYDLVCGE